MTLQTPEGQTRTAELRFYRSSLVQMLNKARAFGYCGYGDVGKACVFAFRGSGARVFVPECQDSHEMVGPSCCSTHAVKELLSMTAGYDCVNNATVATRATTQGPIS